MYAPAKSGAFFLAFYTLCHHKPLTPPHTDHPEITPAILATYDAFIMGVPTRYGNFPAQWKVRFLPLSFFIFILEGVLIALLRAYLLVVEVQCLRGRPSLAPRTNTPASVRSCPLVLVGESRCLAAKRHAGRAFRALAGVLAHRAGAHHSRA
jgi:hypothetical protein